MTRHLLDSDAIIDFLKGIQASIALIEELRLGGDTPCICSAVFAEVYSGLDADRQAQAEPFLLALEFLPTSDRAGRQAGAWRFTYARRGVALATTDCLIAAVALEHGATVVAGNVRDYPMPEITVVPLPRARRSDPA